MNRDTYFARAAKYVFSDRTVWWRSPLLVAAQLVPILGSMASTGYLMVLMRDRAWARERGLPPFSEGEEILRRGASGFVVSFVWGLALVPIALVAMFAWLLRGLPSALVGGSVPQAPWWFGSLISVPSAFLMVFVNVALLRSALYLTIPAGLSLSGVRQIIRRDSAGFRSVAWPSLAVSLAGAVLSIPASVAAHDPNLPWYVVAGMPVASAFLVALVMMPLHLTVACSYGMWANHTNPAQWPPLRSPASMTLPERGGPEETAEAYPSPAPVTVVGMSDQGVSRRRPVFLVTIGVIVVLVWGAALSLGAGAVLRRTRTPVARWTPEWSERVAGDYPTWKVVGFYSFNFAESKDPPETDYVVEVIPPGRGFVIGVLYASNRGGAPKSQDEVLRASGSSHYRAEPLLDYLGETYVDRGRTVDWVTADSAGNASVAWSPDVSSSIPWTGDRVDTLIWDYKSYSWISDSAIEPDSVNPLAASEDLPPVTLRTSKQPDLPAPGLDAFIRKQYPDYSVVKRVSWPSQWDKGRLSVNYLLKYRRDPRFLLLVSVASMRPSEAADTLDSGYMLNVGRILTDDEIFSVSAAQQYPYLRGGQDAIIKAYVASKPKPDAIARGAWIDSSSILLDIHYGKDALRSAMQGPDAFGQADARLSIPDGPGNSHVEIAVTTY